MQRRSTTPASSLQTGRQFTVSASLGGTEGSTSRVQVYATQNADGTGAKVLLAEVSRLSGAGEGYTLYPVVGTPGSPVSAGLAGYYVQVVLVGGGAYYDNIVVTLDSEIGSVCGDAGHPYPIGDMTHDCYVNGQDLEMFAGQWMALDCAARSGEGADLDHAVNNVNLRDFAVLADNWMNCTNPSPPCCCNP